MRTAIIFAGVVIVLAAVGHVVWVESQIVARAYELRELRELEGEHRNQERVLDAAIAVRSTTEALVKAAEELELSEELEEKKADEVVIPEIDEATRRSQ